MNHHPIIVLSNVIMLYEAVCFLWLRPFPTPFSSSDWFLHNGGVDLWGWIFMGAAALSILAHRRPWTKDWYRQLLLTPQNLILQLTGWMMLHKVIITWTSNPALCDRLILGMAYVIPLTVMHCIIIVRGGR